MIKTLNYPVKKQKDLTSLLGYPHWLTDATWKLAKISR